MERYGKRKSSRVPGGTGRLGSESEVACCSRGEALRDFYILGEFVLGEWLNGRMGEVGLESRFWGWDAMSKVESPV